MTCFALYKDYVEFRKAQLRQLLMLWALVESEGKDRGQGIDLSAGQRLEERRRLVDRDHIGDELATYDVGALGQQCGSFGG